MYTLRDFTKTPEDIAKTLARVKKIGYDAVQPSNFGPIDAKELAKIFQGEGLICCATHVSVDELKNQTQKMIDDHKLWGCELVAIGSGNPRSQTTQGWVDFANDYNTIADKFDGSGISIGYHNHSHELSHVDGVPALQVLLEHFSKKVWMEIDVYWITAGGGDPSLWIDRCKGKLPCVHMKDMGVTPQRTQFFAEVGEGNLNWPRIIASCKTSGVKWHIVEQDNCNGKDPFDCVATSLKNLKAMGLS